MDLNNRGFIVGINLRNLEKSPSSQHLIVDIVLVDQSNDILSPLLYRFDPHAFDTASESPSNEHCFALLGEVCTMDKTKKIIYLANNTSVSYRYLIQASGLKQTVLGSRHGEELSAGVHTLMEALRLRDNITTILPQATMAARMFNRKKTCRQAQILPEQDLPWDNIVNILVSTGLDVDGKSLEMALASTEKRLYQVQL